MSPRSAKESTLHCCSPLLKFSSWKRVPFSDFDMRHFWQWSDFQSYVECIMSLAVVGAVFMYFLNDFDPFVEGVGFAAVFTEAMLGVPQFYRNAKNKSTYGMR